MKSETEVIFRPNGTINLQADGGWTRVYKTGAAAGWDAVRSIRGSDPDFGWPGNVPGERIDTESPAFRRENHLISEGTKQNIWYPNKATVDSVASLSDFSAAYGSIKGLPVSLLAACEKGDATAISRSVSGLGISDLEKLLRTVFQIEMPTATQAALAEQIARAPLEEGLER